MDLSSLKTCRVILLFTLFITTTQGFSQGDWTQFGVRPLAMGNAFVSVADDFNALYYNPAGLARIKEWRMEIVNPKFDLSTNSYFFYKNERSKLKKSTVSNDLEIIDSVAGKSQHVGVSLTPYFIAPGWGFGLTTNTFVKFVAHREVDVDAQALSILTLPVSVAGNFLSNQLSLGATVKLEGIGGIDQDISMDNISLISSKSDTQSSQKVSDFLESGIGVGFDFGMLFTPNDTPMEPTFGMSITDIGGTHLKKVLHQGHVARDIPPSVNTGFSLKPFKTERQYVLVALDTQMINQSRNFGHKLSLGAEWGFSQLIKVELGMLDGYLTGGFQFDVWLFKLRFATYAVDRSPLVGLEKSFIDRRVVFQVKILI